MGELTQEQLARYVEDNKCPFCGKETSSDDYDYDVPPSRVISCRGCDRAWVEHYQVVAVTFDDIDDKEGGHG